LRFGKLAKQSKKKGAAAMRCVGVRQVGRNDQNFHDGSVSKMNNLQSQRPKQSKLPSNEEMLLGILSAIVLKKLQF
jgi:hypothetical protein